MTAIHPSAFEPAQARPAFIPRVNEVRPAALLLAPRLGSAEPATLAELAQLVTGLGMEVVGTFIQHATPLASPHLLGSGKLKELKAHVAELALALEGSERELYLVVAADITPSQQRHLGRTLELPVLDRSAVILRVFEARAQTTQARLEVALARARYDLPRVRDDQSLGDREGGGGRAARGHSNVELRKQDLRLRITELERRIAVAERALEVQQKSRREVDRVALVGYTNAGKSSLLNALCGQETYVADKLFATLQTIVRPLLGTSPQVLVSDTVGFMRALPHELLRSFRSTLRDSLDAQLRLVVVDASDPEWTAQLRVTEQVLFELGADRAASLLVFNKVDLVSAAQRDELRGAHPDAQFVSAHSASSVGQLRDVIARRLAESYAEVTVLVPFSDGKRLAELHAGGRVLKQVTTSRGVEVVVRAPRRVAERWGLASP